MAKNDGWCLSTSMSILPEKHYFHLGSIGSKFAPKGRYWPPSLHHCGRHHGKQKHLKVANLQLQPPSSLNHCSFTQHQHARCSFYVTSIDLTCWFGRFLWFCSSRAAEAMKVKSGADIRHGTLGIVFWTWWIVKTCHQPHSNARGVSSLGARRRHKPTAKEARRGKKPLQTKCDFEKELPIFKVRYC